MAERPSRMTEAALRGKLAARAYAIWEREGRPHGRDLDHWLAAEREIARPTAAGASQNRREVIAAHATQGRKGQSPKAQ